MSLVQAVTDRTKLNNSSPVFLDGKASNADWGEAKKLFGYLARLDPSVDAASLAISKETLALRFWEKICEQRGTPQNKSAVDYNADLSLSSVKGPATELGEAFGVFSESGNTIGNPGSTTYYKIYDNNSKLLYKIEEHLIPAKTKLGLVTDHIMAAFDADGSGSINFTEFVIRMAKFRGPYQQLFQRIAQAMQLKY